MIETWISLVEEILGQRENELGADYLGYRNHVYRTIHFCLAQNSFNDEEREKIIIAGCFHDIGIWTAGTFDYLPPSIALARRYLTQHDLEKWIPEIELMIDQHHKLREYKGNPLVEVFRRGDLVDFSLGIVKGDVSRAYIKEVKTQFPNAGFHNHLARLAGRWLFRHSDSARRRTSIHSCYLMTSLTAQDSVAATSRHSLSD